MKVVRTCVAKRWWSTLVPSAAEGYESRALLLLLLQITSRADRTELLINN